MGDKKYIESLSNFADALDQLVEEMQKQSKVKDKGTDKPSGKSLNIDDTLVSIQEGIDQIKDDTKKILNNQDTLIKMGKDSEKSGGLISGVTDKKKKGKIKDGVSTIMLMAGAVLAIGLAFKVVGGVDFASVIALSIALPLIAHAFTTVAKTIKEYELGLGDVLFTSFALVIIAGALTLSSWIMSGIVPIGIFQFLTAIGIAITLGIISIGVSFMLDNLKEVKMSDILKLPVILTAMAAGIAASSYVLGKTTMIGDDLLWNILKQGIVLAIMSTVLSIPMILFTKLGLKTSHVLSGGINIVIMAGAIMTSSHLLSMGNYSVVPSWEWTKGAAGAILLFSIPIVALGLLSMTGVGIPAIIVGSIMAVIVSGTISLISHILNSGVYDNADDLGDWTTAASGAIMLFSVPIIALGALSMTGLGAIAILVGASMAVTMAHTIAEISKVLGGGDFSYGSDLVPWAKATNSLYLTFTPIMTYLGAMGLVSAVLGMFGGPDPFELARNMMVKIAETIVDVSDTLSGGSYGSGPGEDWAKGVSLSIGAFAPVYSMLQSSGVMAALFGGEAMKPEEYTETMRNIGTSINEVGKVFAEGKVDKWEGGPTEDWAKGVGGAIGAFAPIFGIIQENKGFFGGDGVTVEEMTGAIDAISKAIKAAAVKFSGDNTIYKGGPTEKWAKGVGGSIKVFTELYGWVQDGIDWTEKDIKKGNKVIFKIAGTILEMSKIFQGYWVDENGQWQKGSTPVWSKYPSKKWASGVGESMMKFAEIYDWAYDEGWTESYFKEYDPVIKKMADSVVRTANKFSEMETGDDPSKYVKGIAKSLDEWTKVLDKVKKLNTGELWGAINSLHDLSDGFNELAESLENVGTAIEGFNPEFIKVMADVSGVDIEIKNKDEKEDSEKASWWSRLLGRNERLKEENTTYSGMPIKSPSIKEEEGMKLEDIHAKLEELNQQLQQIAQNSGNMSDYVDELRAGSNQGIEIDM